MSSRDAIIILNVVDLAPIFWRLTLLPADTAEKYTGSVPVTLQVEQQGLTELGSLTNHRELSSWMLYLIRMSRAATES